MPFIKNRYVVHPRKFTCPLKRDLFQKERIVFQASFFRGELLVSAKYSNSFKSSKSQAPVTLFKQKTTHKMSP